MRLCENFEIPPTAVGGWFRSFLQKPHFAPMKEIPPTAVGGLFRSGLRTNEGPSDCNGHLSFMDLLREEVGSEPSTNFRWWDSQISEAFLFFRRICTINRLLSILHGLLLSGTPPHIEQRHLASLGGVCCLSFRRASSAG